MTFAYDGANRKVSETGVWGVKFDATLDGSGNRVLVKDSLGGTTTSTYDPLGRLASRMFSDGAPSDEAYAVFAYSPRGELAAVSRFDDLVGSLHQGATSYTYDDAGRVLTIRHYGDGTAAAPFSGTQLTSYAYSYDAGGRLKTERTDGGAPTTYGYDQGNELTQAGDASFHYDLGGNRDDTDFVVGDANQLESQGGWGYEYDAQGNLVGKANASGENWDYAYDHEDRLLTATRRDMAGGPVTATATYAYDALGRRVSSRTWTSADGQKEERYALDGDNAAIDLGASGAVTARRVFGDGADQLLARVGSSGLVDWYLTDRQGSVRGVMENGSLYGTATYDAFGKALTRTGSAGTWDRYGYTGRELDSLTGLMYYRARWYDVDAQRWLTRDPAGFTPGDSNLYRYVGNSPTNATDPTGLAEWWQYVNSWDDFLGDVNHGWFAQASNASAGMADAITGGATAKLRAALGYDDAVDKSSDFYRYGGYAGQAVNIGLMVGNPSGWAGLALQGIKLASTASGLIDTARATLAGDFSGAGSMLLNTALSQLRGAGSPCSAVSRLASLAQRGMHLYGIYKGASQAVDKFSQGDIIGGMLGLAETGVNAYQFLQACFAAGTKIQTRRGWVPIEEVVVGDEVWSKPEAAPNHPGGWRPVEEVFVKTGRILELRVGGQLIRTTPEHPFFVVGQGWVEAGSLKEGDLLCSRDRTAVPIEAVEDTGEHEKVYNCCVGEWHTYFVGGELWSFDVWAHNATVYEAKDDSTGKVRYVGLANRRSIYDLPERLKKARASTGLPAAPIPNQERAGSLPVDRRGPEGRMGPLTAREAECVEATLIRFHGRESEVPGGTLTNVKPGNNVSTPGRYKEAMETGTRLLNQMGYPGFEDVENIAWKEPARF